MFHIMIKSQNEIPIKQYVVYLRCIHIDDDSEPSPLAKMEVQVAIISHTVQYSKTFKHTYISLMSYGTRSGLNFIQVIFPVLWRSSRVSWGSGFRCPTSYGWSIACQNLCKTDRNNIVSMVVIKTI